MSATRAPIATITIAARPVMGSGPFLPCETWTSEFRYPSPTGVRLTPGAVAGSVEEIVERGIDVVAATGAGCGGATAVVGAVSVGNVAEKKIGSITEGPTPPMNRFRLPAKAPNIW